MAQVETSRFGALLFILISVAALVIGVWQGIQTGRFLGRALPAVGRMVAAPGQASAAMTSAHPTIEFVAANGVVVRYRQDGMGARPVGETVELLYDPASPAGTAVVRSFWTQWFPVVGPLLLGLAFLAVPLFGAAIGLRGARP